MNDFLTGELLGYTTEGRPLIRNKFGGASSEYTLTTQDPRNPAQWINAPSIYGGQVRLLDDVLRRIMDANYLDPETGNPIQSYSTLGEAIEAARQRSNAIQPRFFGSEYWEQWR